MKVQIAICSTLVAGLALAAALPSAEAAPLSSATAIAPATGNVQTVQYRGWHGHRGYYGHRRGWGRGVGPFLGGLAAGAVIGGALDDDGPAYSYDGGGGSEDGAARCAATFRSFNPSTGTYTTYGGETRMCPYL